MAGQMETPQKQTFRYSAPGAMSVLLVGDFSPTGSGAAFPCKEARMACGRLRCRCRPGNTATASWWMASGRMTPSAPCASSTPTAPRTWSARLADHLRRRYQISRQADPFPDRRLPAAGYRIAGAGSCPPGFAANQERARAIGPRAHSCLRLRDITPA